MSEMSEQEQRLIAERSLELLMSEWQAKQMAETQQVSPPVAAPTVQQPYDQPGALLPTQPVQIAEASPLLKPIMYAGGCVLALLGCAIIYGFAKGEPQSAQPEPMPTPSAIATPSPTPTPSPSPSPQQMPLQPNVPDAPAEPFTHVVTGNAGDCLNVRDHNQNIKGCIPVGAKVLVTGYTGDRLWAITEYQGRAAFLYAQHLQAIERPQIVAPNPVSL